MTDKNLKFSDRIGATRVPSLLQLNEMSPALRASLWNVIHLYIDPRPNNSGWIRLADFTAVQFRKFPIDDLPRDGWSRKKWIRAYFDTLQWYEVYNYIEFLSNGYSSITQRANYTNASLMASFNDVLENEQSGYRFIGDTLSPIISNAEIVEVESALHSSERAALKGANEHLRSSIALLSQKPNPDYRNSIKEAISAIESIAKILGDPEAQGLAGALTQLGKKVSIHGALNSAFLKLYGYASDEKGIRHALLEDDAKVGFDEAKYMVVACSAFMNYLISKAAASGLLTDM